MIQQDVLKSLQFDVIKEEVIHRAIGDYTKEQISNFNPQSNLEVVKTLQQETAEARFVIESGQHIPFMGLTHISHLIDEIKKGLLLTPNELLEVADFLRSNRLIFNFFEKLNYQTPLLYNYSQRLGNFSEIETLFYDKIHNNQLVDTASKNLRRIRQKINECNREIEDKLQKFLKHPDNQTLLQERIIIKKGDHFTVPIKNQYKNKVSGSLIEQSNKGMTVFIEPTAIAKLNEQLILLQSEELAEEYQLLAELAGFINEEIVQIEDAIETITAFDLIVARAKYSRDILGITPMVNKEEQIKIIQGKHPLLSNNAIPLNFTLGEDFRGMIITGANAGGKTVVLKTVGLLTIMTMFGLQIPAKEGTKIAVLDQLFVDIGDKQDIENSLSTFSGHIHAVGQIVSKVTRHTLILMDEIGSGTEPNEGAALAIALMETMYAQGALVVATTHYGEIKEFAKHHQDFIPAAMTFDKEQLQPLYQLKMNEVGESQALWIAKKMNLPNSIVTKAAQYIENKNYATEKIEFHHEKTENQDSLNQLIYQKGDRVKLTESQQIGIVYTDSGKDFVDVFVDKAIRSISRKRMSLEMRADLLYPSGYDLDSLFIDYAARKQTHDLNRGSKKAQKKLLKEARKRKQTLDEEK